MRQTMLHCDQSRKGFGCRAAQNPFKGIQNYRIKEAHAVSSVSNKAAAEVDHESSDAGSPRLSYPEKVTQRIIECLQKGTALGYVRGSRKRAGPSL